MSTSIAIPLLSSVTSPVYGSFTGAPAAVYQARRWIYDLSGVNFQVRDGEYLWLDHTDAGPFPENYVWTSGDVLPYWAGRPADFRFRNYDDSYAMLSYPDGTDPQNIPFTENNIKPTADAAALGYRPEGWIRDGHTPDPVIAAGLLGLGNQGTGPDGNPAYLAFHGTWHGHTAHLHGPALVDKKLRYYVLTIRLGTVANDAELTAMQGYLQQFAPVLTHVTPDEPPAPVLAPWPYPTPVLTARAGTSAIARLSR